ncbi:hypothetical protein [Salipaludibacillus daqingensis]|uniref:hypothetical protein n=1 Tax=Salipaludibacillus daqingensis TaxID=3041001 RepID=UPI002472EED7|nr:hypothetical protein [Salipaludibacillus daqingensis]
MIQLYHIENNYPFQEISWHEKNKVIQTDKGKKAVALWKDENDLNWHIHWREKLSKEAGVLTDRVIRTNNGEQALATDIGWITVHDVIESLFPVSDHPFEMGRFLGTYANIDMECHRPSEDETVGRMNAVPASLPLSRPIVQKMEKEAIRRERKAQQILKGCPVNVNKVAKVGSLNQARSVQGQLFWQNNEREIDSSVDMLCSCLREWVSEYGESKLDTLLDGLNETYSFENDKGKLILAYFVYPNEFISFGEWYHENRSAEEVDIKLDELCRQWDISKKIVEHIADRVIDIKEQVS